MKAFILCHLREIGINCGCLIEFVLRYGFYFLVERSRFEGVSGGELYVGHSLRAVVGNKVVKNFGVLHFVCRVLGAYLTDVGKSFPFRFVFEKLISCSVLTLSRKRARKIYESCGFL